jgi:hypothetical protein
MNPYPRYPLMTRNSHRQALMMKTPVQVCDGTAACGLSPIGSVLLGWSSGSVRDTTWRLRWVTLQRSCGHMGAASVAMCGEALMSGPLKPRCTLSLLIGRTLIGHRLYR